MDPSPTTMPLPTPSMPVNEASSTIIDIPTPSSLLLSSEIKVFPTPSPTPVAITTDPPTTTMTKTTTMETTTELATTTDSGPNTTDKKQDMTTDNALSTEDALTTNPTEVTSEPNITATDKPGIHSAIIIGVVAALLCVILVMVVGVVIVLIIMRRRRHHFKVPNSEFISPLDNPTYEVSNNSLEDEGKETAPVYATLNDTPTYIGQTARNDGSDGYSIPHGGEAQQRQLNSSLVYYEVGPSTEDQKEPQDYALPVASTHSTIESQPYEVPVTSLQAHHDLKVRVSSLELGAMESSFESYSLKQLDSAPRVPQPGEPLPPPIRHLAKTKETLVGAQYERVVDHEYRVLDRGIYVPTGEEREQYMASITSSASHTFDESIYSRIGQKYTEQLRGNSFFLEDERYWPPASSKTALYDQLSKKKYREIPRPRIRIIKHLGSGQFGSVNLGHWQQSGEELEVAVKNMIPQSTDEDKVKFLQEAAIMGQFLHPNIVRLYGVVTMGDPVMIVLEYMEKGDLKKYLLTRQPKPGEMADRDLSHLLLKFCREIASGMDYLSSKSFVHRDLAARNILVGSDTTCKIGDFGMSRNLEDNNYYITHGGKIPVKWTAPEALNFRKYSPASDVWSFGAVMYETWSLGRKPFDGYTNEETMALVAKGFRLPPPPGCSRALYELIIRCWHFDAMRRPVFSAIVKMLNHSDSQLLSWNPKDLSVHTQVAHVGAPCEVSEELYQDLQDYYLNRTN